MPDLELLRAEATRQGLALTDEDLKAIQAILEPIQADLARLRSMTSEIFEPPYHFTPLEQSEKRRG